MSARVVWLEDGKFVEPDPAKLFGVRRAGAGSALYKRTIKHDPCAYCGEPAPLGLHGGHEIDHIRSRWRGGPNHWTNYTAACEFCNANKLDMVLSWLWILHGLRRGIGPTDWEYPR